MTIFPQLETDLLDAHQRLTHRRRSRAIGWITGRHLATRTSVLFASVTLGLAGGATALAASAGVLPFTPSATGTTVTNPPGSAPKVNGVPIDPTTGAGVQPSNATPTETGTTVTPAPATSSTGSTRTVTGVATTDPTGPAPKVNGVPIDPTTGAGVQPSNTTPTETGTTVTAR
jgi:hypothetical protein